jgi:hypothetical protein
MSELEELSKPSWPSSPEKLIGTLSSTISTFASSALRCPSLDALSGLVDTWAELSDVKAYYLRTTSFLKPSSVIEPINCAGLP